MLSHLIYISLKSELCTERSIQDILHSARKNNANLDITGVLLHTETKFIQCLEGEYNTIMRLYDNIKTDNRHKNVALISVGPLKERLFPSWQMACKYVGEKELRFDTAVCDEDKKIFESLLYGNTDAKGNTYVAALSRIFRANSKEPVLA